jgi:uncharacterized protein YjiS (DUF1127 family)
MTFSEQLIESYITWLKTKLTVKELGDMIDHDTLFGPAQRRSSNVC